MDFEKPSHTDTATRSSLMRCQARRQPGAKQGAAQEPSKTTVGAALAPKPCKVPIWQSRHLRRRAVHLAAFLCSAALLAMLLERGAGAARRGDSGCLCDPDVLPETCATESRHWLDLVSRAQMAPNQPEGLSQLLQCRVGARGRMVVAGRDIAAGEVVLRVEGDRLLTGATYRNRSATVRRLIDAEEAGEVTYVSPQTKVALLLLDERRLGAASPYASYLAIMPPTFNVPVLTGIPAESALSVTSLARRVRQHRADLERQHQDLVRVLGAEAPSLPDFLWARAAVGSRVFDGHRIRGLRHNEGDAMVPLGDMLNHAQGDARNLDVGPHSLGFMFTANRRIPMGEELHMSYGRNSAAEWYLHYGFTPDGNHPEAAKVRLYIEMEQDMPLHQQKAALMRSMSTHEDFVLPVASFDLRATADSVGEKLLNHLRFLLADDGRDLLRRMEDGKLCRPYSDPPVCQRISDANERRVLGWLRQRLSSQLAAVDAALGSAGRTGRDAHHILEEERRVLDWWVQRAGRELSALDATSA